MKGLMPKFTFAAISIAVACGLDHSHNIPTTSLHQKPFEELNSTDFQELFGKAHDMIKKKRDVKAHSTTLLLPRRMELNSPPPLRKKDHIDAKQVNKGYDVENTSTLTKGLYSKEEKNAYSTEDNALYVQNAKHCTVKREKEDDGNYSHFVEMIGLDFVTNRIANLPLRKVHQTSSLLFSAAFETFFERKPNAVLSFQDSFEMHDHNQTGHLLNIVVEAIETLSDRKNLERYRYKIDEPKDVLFLDNKNIMYNQCTIFIDAVKNTDDVFPKLLFQSKIVKDAAERLAAAKIAPKPDDPDSVEEISVNKEFIEAKAETLAGKKEGLGKLSDGDKYNAMAQVAVGADALTSIINACNSGGSSCNGPSVAKAVGNVIMSVGTIVTVAFPPAGMVLVLVGALTSLIAGFFSGSNSYISKIPGLTDGMVQAAVTRALANEQVDLDISFLSATTGWVEARQRTAAHNLDMLESLPAGNLDTVIESYYDQVQFDLNDIEGYVNKMNTDLYSSFGDGSTAIRSEVKKWLNECSVCWFDTTYPDLLKNGNSQLGQCEQKSNQAKTPWNSLKKIGITWINLALEMQTYMQFVRKVLCQHSECDCKKSKQPPLCPYNSILFSNAASMEQLMLTVNFLQSTVMNGDYNFQTVCQSASHQWPWNQQCDSASSCNYKYALVLPDDSQINQLGQRGKFLKEEYYESNIAQDCQNAFNTLSPQGAFWENTVYGYSGADDNQMMEGNCGQVSSLANDGHIDLIAIQNYCPEEPDCRVLFNNAANWGLPATTCSVSLPDGYVIRGADTKGNCYQATIGGLFWQSQHSSDCDTVIDGSDQTLVGSYNTQVSTAASEYWSSGASCDGHGVNNKRAGHVMVRNDCSKVNDVPTVVESPECVYWFNVYVCCPE